MKVREQHFCRACGKQISILLRTDRRTCSDRCRQWLHRHPERKRIERERGKVPLPPPPGRRRPKTLAVALRLLADTRAYASKLEASTEALALELAWQENVTAELRAQLIRVREHAAQAEDALTTSNERARGGG